MGEWVTYKENSMRLERDVANIAAQAKKDVAMLGARSTLLEAAMRVILKQGLLNELVHETNNPPTDERDRLQAAVHELEEQVNLLESKLQKARTSREQDIHEVPAAAERERCTEIARSLAYGDNEAVKQVCEQIALAIEMGAVVEVVGAPGERAAEGSK